MVTYTGLVSKFSKENLNTNTTEKFSGVCVNVSNQYAPCQNETVSGGSPICE